MEALREEVARTIEEVREVADVLRGLTGNTQTIIHRSEGMGAWGTAAVVACFLTYLSLTIFAVWSIIQINDLTAWKDVHAAKIARLEASQEIKK